MTTTTTTTTTASIDTTASPKAIGQLVIELRDLILELHDRDANEIALDYGFLLTGGERENYVSHIQQFKQELDERDNYLDEADKSEILAERVLTKIQRVLKDGFTSDEATAINKEFNEVFDKYGNNTTKEDTDEMLGDLLHQILFTNDEVDLLDEMVEHPLETDGWKQVCEKAYSC